MIGLTGTSQPDHTRASDMPPNAAIQKPISSMASCGGERVLDAEGEGLAVRRESPRWRGHLASQLPRRWKLNEVTIRPTL